MDRIREIFDFIDSNEDLAVELEAELTRRPAISPVSGGEGELDKCLFLEQWLSSHGIDALERYDAPDPRAKGGVRPNLIATIQGNNEKADTPCLWIMSHLDVVPVGEASLWDSDPWTMVKRDGRLYGVWRFASGGRVMEEIRITREGRYADVSDNGLLSLSNAIQADAAGTPVDLPFIDFLMIVTGQDLPNSIVGEHSTEAGTPTDRSIVDPAFVLTGLPQGSQYQYTFVNNSGYDLTITFCGDTFELKDGTSISRTVDAPSAPVDFFGGNVKMTKSEGQATFTSG